MRVRIPIVALLLIVLLGTAVFTVAGSTNLQTADEYHADYSDLAGEEAIVEYSEFELIRSQVVIDLQTIDLTDQHLQQYDELLQALETFIEAYELHETGAYTESLASAQTVEDHLEAAADVGADEYSAIGLIALDRFYGELGEEFYTQAQAEDHSPARLDLLESAATAYDQAGDSQWVSTILVEQSDLNASYHTDTDRMQTHLDDAETFTAECEAACDGPATLLTEDPLGAIGTYERAQSAFADADEAEDLAATHGLDDSAVAAATAGDDAFSAMVATAAVTASLIGGLLVILGLVLLLVMWRLGHWERDVLSARTDDVVDIQGGVGNG